MMIDPKVLHRAQSILSNHTLNPSLKMITTRHNTDPNIELWKVKSIDGTSYSIVSHDKEKAIWECSCKFYQFRGECKHIVVIKICREKEIYLLPDEEENNNNEI